MLTYFSGLFRSIFVACIFSACNAEIAVPTPSEPLAPGEAVAFTEVKDIIAQRCASCHAARPTQPGFSRPAAGLSLETAEQIQARAGRIHERVSRRTMPPMNNITGMTSSERETIQRWFSQGAKP